MHPQQQQIVSDFPHSGAGVALFVLVAVIMAPLFEEIVFRGFLFRGFANSWGWVWGALASARRLRRSPTCSWTCSCRWPRSASSLAWAYKRTGSLWTSITMHALFNAIAVLAWALTG